MELLLSHSSQDNPFVKRLADRLRNEGATVWIDEAEIKIGDSLIVKIAEGIDNVDFVAAIISSHSVKSAWVQKELNLGLLGTFTDFVYSVLLMSLNGFGIPLFCQCYK